MPLQSGARLGPYEIVSLIGRGGMGEVYRATDTRVGRTVAVKVLPPDAAAQPERRQRFEREARAVARLNHPHICALYDVGRQDDIEFLVMEFLDGETMGARLSRGPLLIDEALKHATALAQALARAHREGITHRDIKPSNVMLTEGGVKLLDFGLAKLRDRSDTYTPGSPIDDASTGEALSRDGSLVGTLAYMSPEQLEARPVDGRTDIYALGLVVYEMITGQKAFARTSQAGLIAAILKEDPPAMTSVQPRTPASVERIVLIALAKDPDKRWQDAGDFARELAWVATGSHTTTVEAGPRPARSRLGAWLLPAAVVLVAFAATAVFIINRASPETRSLVILPCRASDDPTAQAYCDGLTDTLSAKMTPLAVARGLQITSTVEVRGRGVRDAAQARREFGATLILEGGILRAADTLRVNYVLVDAKTLKQIDAYSATSAVGDPFALQDRVSTWAAGVLALNLNAGERRTLIAAGTQTAGALELYLQGHGYVLDYQKPANVDAAIDLFSRAIALDPRYALAYAGLGSAFWRKYDASHDAIWVPQARSACTRAVALDPEGAASRICLGTVALGTGEFEEAVREFRRASDREPMNDEAQLGLARAQERTGAIAAAEETYKEAIVLRPQYWASHEWLGIFYRDQARYAEAAKEYEAAVALTPDNARAHYALGGLYLLFGRYEDAIAAFRTSVSLGPTGGAYANWGITYFYLRRFPESARMLERACQIEPSAQFLGDLARTYYWGERAKAQAAYERALAAGESELKVNPHDVDLHLLMADYTAKVGRPSETIEHLAQAHVSLEADPHRLFFAALAYHQLGDDPMALELLEKAVARKLPPSELTAWIDLDSLRGTPRFQVLMNAARH